MMIMMMMIRTWLGALRHKQMRTQRGSKAVNVLKQFLVVHDNVSLAYGARVPEADGVRTEIRVG